MIRTRMLRRHWNLLCRISPVEHTLLTRKQFPGINIKCFSQVSDSSSIDESSFKMVVEKIDHLFEKTLSKKKYFVNSDNIDYLIIDDTKVTMGHPLIGIDIQSLAKDLMESPELPGTRTKPMYALVTGMGRGKTRLLVELNRELKKNPGVFSMAITFNHHWDPPTSSSSALRLCNVEIKYAAAIISRVLSIHYHIPFGIATEIVEEFILEAGKGISAVTLIGGCIRFIVRQMRRENPNIYRFFLLVDESMKIADTLMEPDIHNILRKAVLDTQLMSPDESPLVVDLVMSSLDIKAIGVSDSNRMIRSISTPTQLNVEEVLEKWVKRHVVISDETVTSNDTKSMSIPTLQNILKLKCLIACLSPVPRALQFLITVLSKIGDNVTFDAQTIKYLYNTTIQSVKDRYPTTINLPPKYGKALLFGEAIHLDDTFMFLIKESVFVNSLVSLSRSMIVRPETSIVSMQRLVTDTGNLWYTSVIANTIESLLDNLVNSTGIEDAGKPLEIIMRGLIDARLQVLVDLLSEDENSTTDSRKTFTLQSLLMMKTTSTSNYEGGTSSKASAFFLDHQKMRVLRGKSSQTTCFPQSNKNVKSKSKGIVPDMTRKFLKQANEITLTPFISYIKVTLHPAECADGMWVIRNERNDPFILAVDCKSQHIGQPVRKYKYKSKSRSAFDELPGRGLQAMHFLNITKEATAWPAADVRDGSMLNALRCGTFLYVYVNTQAESTVAVGDHVLQLGQEDSSRFLSFFKSYYMLHRVSSGSTDIKSV